VLLHNSTVNAGMAGKNHPDRAGLTGVDRGEKELEGGRGRVGEGEKDPGGGNTGKSGKGEEEKRRRGETGISTTVIPEITCLTV